MKHSEISAHRLASQGLAPSSFGSVAEVVGQLGAIQAQDYRSALWAIALRLPGAGESDIEQAIADRRIIRTWPMRGTLHFVPAEDVRWMLTLMTPRVLSGARRRWQDLELDDTVISKSRKVLAKALAGGKYLARNEMMSALDQAGISSANQRGIHILSRLAMEGLLCHGPRVGNQPSFTLLEEWAPRQRSLDHEAALAEIALRYFKSHGPATLQDFVWWTGLKVSEAKMALETAGTSLDRRAIDGVDYWMALSLRDNPHDPARIHLLPPFDEYLVGYRNRIAALDPASAVHIVPGGNGVFLPIMVHKGRVVGTWKRTPKRNRIHLSPVAFEKFPKAREKAFASAARQYAQFLNLPVVIKATQSLNALTGTT